MKHILFSILASFAISLSAMETQTVTVQSEAIVNQLQAELAAKEKVKEQEEKSTKPAYKKCTILSWLRCKSCCCKD